MSDTDAAVSSPSPMSMPGAADAVTRSSLTADQPAVDYSQTTQAPDSAGDAADSDSGPTLEAISAERDKWKQQAQTNEKRAKSNAEKAKAYDADYEKFKAAYEREQGRLEQDDDDDQPSEEDEVAARAAEAEARAAEAEANLLRFRLAEGVPEWAMGLITGGTEEEIEAQVEELKENLAAYAATITEPRRPAPNPLAGRAGQLGSTPQEAFQSAFSNILR